MNYITQDSFESNVRVAVRIRPISKKEEDSSAKEIITVVGNSLHIRNVKIEGDAEIGDSRERLKTFTFDYVYPQSGDTDSELVGSQEQIFQDLGTDLLRMLSTATTAAWPVLTPERRSQREQGDHQVHASFLEIYNERVRDLLGRRQANERYTLKATISEECPREISSKIHLVDLAGRWVWKLMRGFSRHQTLGTDTRY
uniref:Kinesin motor domain-containing protein n=1 Tax=Macrostomum lignano TaxID=282301 RepID=A0A1I8H876_9PLAT